MSRIEYSTMCLSEENYLQKIREADEFVRRQGFGFGIQIHNSIEPGFYEKLLDLRADYPFSIHSPVFGKFFLNLASRDYDFAKENIAECVPHLDAFDTDILFFHAFFMTETRIQQDMKNYRSVIRDGVGEQYCLNDSFVMDPSLFDTDVYARYRETFRKNLARLREEFRNSGLVIALENDFVGIGSGLQRPQEIDDLVDNLWFDLGHFWTSSVLHGFDYHEEAGRLIDAKNIVGVHLNHNLVKRDSQREEIRDSHAHFRFESEMNLKPIVRRLFEKNVGIITLEILDGDIADVEQLFRWIE